MALRKGENQLESLLSYNRERLTGHINLTASDIFIALCLTINLTCDLTGRCSCPGFLVECVLIDLVPKPLLQGYDFFQ